MSREEKEIQIEIGKRIKKIREEKHISQEKLMELSGVTNTTISAYENNKKNIGLTNLANIAKGLGLTIDVLYYGTEEESPIKRARHDTGRKIVNCVFELFKERVINGIYDAKMNEHAEWEVGLYEQPLVKFINTLLSIGGDYDSTPEQTIYVEKVKETAAYEINKEKEQMENRSRIRLEKTIEF